MRIYNKYAILMLKKWVSGEMFGGKKEICNFCFCDTLFKPVWVALRSIPHGMSATLPPSQGDKKNWDWKISIDKGHICE